MNLLDTDPDDREVIASIANGDSNAYEVLVRRYQKPIFNLMFRMTGGSYEDATDLTQETFIKAYEHLYRFQNGEKFFPWLYTIGLNHSKNFLRQKKSRRTISIEDCDLGSGLDYPRQQEENLCARIDHRHLNAALGRLPLDYREALILRYHEGLSMEDVASALKLKMSAAKMRVHRGLEKLRCILETK